ncbi:unnamed protein product [Laminaria digitata]
MVNIRHNDCSHGTCRRPSAYGVESSQAAVFCKQHAEDGMVLISRKRCSRDMCAKGSSFNFEDSKMPAFCMDHAEDGMVDVRRKLSSQTPLVIRRDLDDNDGEATAKRGRQDSRSTFTSPVAQEVPSAGHIKAELLLSL